MPSPNVEKTDIDQTYYHVYGRGKSRSNIFQADEDFVFFRQLFERYLSSVKNTDISSRKYPNFSGTVRLGCYCLMSNHFHLFIHQERSGEMARFMKCLLNSYARYFNHKYGLTGKLLESRYKASMIDDESYLIHISRYIHMNPVDWLSYKHSSLPDYIDGVDSDWLEKQIVLRGFSSKNDYLQFLHDYSQEKVSLAIAKSQLVEGSY